ncbi:hypothetical protein BDR26DRAFT_179923 [Obelidium mucronatum]|nr:hypothetical protein BDR26DRAFT_179923 [Obelidium mucronatum]
MSAVPAILPRNVCIDCGKCFLHQVTFQTGECTCERSKSPPQLPGNGVIITSDAKLKFVQSIRHPIFASCLIKMQTRISACQSHAKKIRDAGKVYEEDASGSAKPLALPTVASISNSQPIAAWPQNVAVDNALQLIANDPQAPVDNSSQLPAIDSEDYPFDLDDFDHPRHDPVPELQDLPQTKQPLFFPLRNSSSFNESPQFRESDGPHWFGNTTRVGERYQASAPTSCFDSSCPSEQSDHRHLKRQISNENEPRFGKKINLDDEGFEKAASCEIMVPVVAVDDATGKDIQSISMFTKLTRLTSLNKASFIRLVTDSKPAWSNLLFKIAFRDTKAAAKQEIEDDGLAFVLRVKVKAVKGVFQFPNGFSFVVFLSKGSSSSASAQPATHRRDILDKLAGHPHTRNDSLGQLKELYVGTCQVKDNHGDHSNGCFRRNGYHLLLSEDKHLRPWARILLEMIHMLLLTHLPTMHALI